MDEPLSNLDAKLRVQTRAEIARLHQRLGTTIVYVTHDQVEAMTMGTRIAVMSDGPAPAGRHAAGRSTTSRSNRFVAGFIGSPSMNFVEVTVEGTGDDATPRRRRRLVDPAAAALPRVGRRDERPARSSPASGPEHLELGEAGADTRHVPRRAPTSSSTSATRSCSTSPRPNQDIVAIVDSSHRVKPGDILKLVLPLDEAPPVRRRVGRIARPIAPPPPPERRAGPNATRSRAR